MKIIINTFVLVIFHKCLIAGGQNYETLQIQDVRIGNQIWSAENLSTTNFQNGDQLFHAKNATEWDSANLNVIPAWAFPEFKNENNQNGKLYNKHAVLDKRNISPLGYRIPTNNDWNQLFEFLGDSTASKLKSTQGWDVNHNYDNHTGFNAKPNGKMSCNSWGGGLTTSAYFWFVTEEKKLGAVKLLAIYHQHGTPHLFDDCYGFSIRCIKQLE